MGILTVGIVTIPFVFEGRKRSVQADFGLKDMREAVDTLLIIRNDKLRELYGNLTLKQAFSHADEVLCTAAKGIAEVITLTGTVNVDMNDVKTVMRDSGVAIMGSGKASGEGRAKRAVQTALESPLLNDNDINGANFILLNITFGQEELLMDEISEITDHIQEQAGMNAEVIWGYGQDPNLGEDICVTVIATGFHAKTVESVLPTQASQPVKHVLDVPQATNEVIQKVTKPTEEVKAENVVENNPEVEPFMKTTFHLNDEVVETPKASTPPQADLFASEEIPSISSMKLKSEEPVASEKPNFISLNDEVKNEVYSSENIASDSFMHKASNVAVSDRPARAELMARNKDREMKIREFTLKLKSPSGLNDLENEPAYMRRKVSLENVQHSTESTVSRFSLNESVDENGEKRTELRDNNPFLHDNVD
jgi:cell division protein FtsZ